MGILHTAKNDIDTQMSSFEKGAYNYINKSFNSVVLKSRAENLLWMRVQLAEKFSKQFKMQQREITIKDANQKFLRKIIDVIEKFISAPI